MAMAKIQKQRIRWRRLKRLAEIIANRPVAIHCSTEVPKTLKAAADIYNNQVDIILNLQHVKSEEDILRALSHELAHVTTATMHHCKDFDTAWAKIYAQMKDACKRK